MDTEPELMEWERPKPVPQRQLIRITEYVPPYDDIPSIFRATCGDAKPWLELADSLFFQGAADLSYRMRDGVDSTLAFIHLRLVLNTWELKHEHKITAIAYLMSRWFEQFEIITPMRKFE